MRAGDLLQIGTNLLIERERQFLTRRDHMTSAPQQIFELRGDFGETRACGMTNHFRLALHVRRDFHADGFAESDDVADVLADLVRIDVHRGNEFDPRLGEKETRDLRSDGSDAVNCDVDWLHRVHGGALYKFADRGSQWEGSASCDPRTANYAKRTGCCSSSSSTKFDTPMPASR